MRPGSDFDDLVTAGEAEPAGTDGDWELDEEPPGSRIDDWWERRGATTQRALRWVAPAAVVVTAATTRLWGLGHPASLVFDETFYVKDAWTLWNLGYEGSWPAEADVQFNAGQSNIFLTDPSFVVHPPLGKWIIGLGMEWLGADNPVGWRIMTAIVGILAVILLMLVAKKLFQSALLATIAGGLMAIDGNAIVMSRVALLDNSVMFFALLGFGAILLDREWSARRLALWYSTRADAGRPTDWGPALWLRPWLVAAGLAFGLATAVKWNGLYFLAAFAVYSLVVDAVARRRAGVTFWLSGTIWKQGPVTFLLTVPIAVAAYFTTWIGWFRSTDGYDRLWSSQNDNAWGGLLAWVPRALQSWWHFEVQVYNYNVGEHRPHAYQANPLTWLFLVRPTSMYYQGSTAGENGCTSNCGEWITGLANPLIWWAATAAILYLSYRLVRYREWKVGLILAGMAAGYLPWLLYTGRTVFQFYTIAFEPYLLLGLVFVIGMILGTARDPRWQRTSGIRLVAIFIGLAIAISVFFWPVWTGQLISYDLMAFHWWLPSWR
ncbi:MAG: phospholipid carrier-dependent glycosyltransferase [Rhodoglobus sp.]